MSQDRIHTQNRFVNHCSIYSLDCILDILTVSLRQKKLLPVYVQYLVIYYRVTSNSKYICYGSSQKNSLLHISQSTTARTGPDHDASRVAASCLPSAPALASIDI